MTEVLFKVVIIGDSQVGKTSFVKRYVNNTFHPNYKTTIGVDFLLKVVKWSDTFNVKIQLWDIAEPSPEFESKWTKSSITTFLVDQTVVVYLYGEKYVLQKKQNCGVLLEGDIISGRLCGLFYWCSFPAGVACFLFAAVVLDLTSIVLRPPNATLWRSADIKSWQPTKTVFEGQERLSSMTSMYYRGAHGCMVVFDVTREETFYHAARWKQDLDDKCTQPDGSSIPCFLMANKCDRADKRQVSKESIQDFITEHGFIAWSETSVKDGMMVSEPMQYLIEQLIAKHTQNDDVTNSTLREASKSVRLQDNGFLENRISKAKKCNC